MRKNYVLDTNVLIQSPYSILNFDEHNVIIPMICLVELDKLKSEEGERGLNARESIRLLESMRQKGDLLQGVELPGGGMLRIEAGFSEVGLHGDFSLSGNDNRILQVCKGLQLTDYKDGAVVLITKDILMRLKAQMVGVLAEDLSAEQAPRLDNQYTGRLTVYTDDEDFATFRTDTLEHDKVYYYVHNEKTAVEPVYNQFFVIHSGICNRPHMLGRFDGEKIVPLEHSRKEPFGVRPKNIGQYFLQEALMMDAQQCPLVIVKGPAGTAKTFYSLAVGLEKVLTTPQEREYRKILVTRPNVQFDEDIGFLPGTEQEKIAPYLRPVIDNLEILVDGNERERYRSEKELRGKIDALFDRGIITAEALNFIRGRTITHTYLIIDEAQNLTPKQAKGIITRVGKGTKVILLGDPEQIDHPLLDERTNGLSYAGARMKGSKLCYQLTLRMDECERSQLAFDAAGRMVK